MLEGVHYSFAFAFHRERAFNVSPSTAAEVRNAAMEESEPHNESDWQRVFDRHCRTAEESTQSAESEEKREKDETNKDEEKRKEKEEQRRREATRRQTETIKEMQKRKKPLLSSWRSWTFESLDWQSGFDEGELLGNRWREWVTECGSKTLTETQKWCFEGQLHLLQTLSKEQMMRAAQEQHLLVFAVLSRSIETVKFVIQSTAENDAQTRAMLRNGEAWTGFTALHVAVFLRLEQIASVLWNACKAQVCAKDLFMGSVLDYCDLLGLFKKEEEPVMHVLFWNDAEHKSEVLSSRDVWREKFGCEYQSKMTADCTWLDELMFGGVYVKDIKRALKDQCAAAQQKQRGKKRVILGRVNDDVGYGLFAFDDFGYDEVIVPYVGRLHTDRFRWTNPEKTTPMRLDFMRQIHELGPKGEGLIKPRTLPQKYARDPSFNFAILDTSFFVNCFESGDESRFINHSSQHANCRLDWFWSCGFPNVVVVALRPISRGEQLLLNYETDLWAYFKRRDANIAPKSILNYDETSTWRSRDGKRFFCAKDEKDCHQVRINF